MNNVDGMQKIMSGRKSKQKGSRVERDIVKLLNQIEDVEAKKVPLSGAVKGYEGDIEISHCHKVSRGKDKLPHVLARRHVVFPFFSGDLLRLCFSHPVIFLLYLL